MLIESVILTACLQGKGCSESTSAYYQQNKDLQLIVEDISRYGREIASSHPKLVYIATPIYTLSVSKEASVQIYQTLMLEVSLKQETVGIKWSY